MSVWLGVPYFYQILNNKFPITDQITASNNQNHTIYTSNQFPLNFGTTVNRSQVQSNNQIIHEIIDIDDTEDDIEQPQLVVIKQEMSELSENIQPNSNIVVDGPNFQQHKPTLQSMVKSELPDVTVQQGNYGEYSLSHFWVFYLTTFFY